MSYHLRTRALHGDMSRYRCCGGFHPCVGRCHEESCPEVCLCLEVCCCFASSVMSTRLMLQSEMQLGNSACDDRLICLVGIFETAACIVSCVDEDLGHLLHMMADGVYVSVCGCMQSQHKAQLDARDAGTIPTFATNVVMVAPPGMQQMVQMQPGVQMNPMHGGGGGYPPAQPMGYGQPQPMGYGQPQPMGYGQPAPMGYGQPQQQVVYAQPAPMYYAPQPVGGPGAPQYGNPMYAPPGAQYAAR